MRTSRFSISSFLILIFLILLIQSSIDAQWNPQTNSTTASINREGSVGIGLSIAPYAQLHVRQEVQATIPGQEIGFIPAFRLQRDFNTESQFLDGTYTWDFFPNEGLQINYGDGTYSALALNIQSYGLEVAGSKLYLGYGGASGNDNMTIGYSNSLNGHFITFNGTYGDGIWQGPSGKTVIHSSSDGSLFFLTQDQNGYIGPGENRRLTITPGGTTIVGDREDAQVLNISSNLRSILRFERKGSGSDFEMLRNDNGDLEFRGGQDGEGTALPSLMKLKKSGKLVIGTEDTPTDLDGGDIDISNFRLFVEGGILTKEIRVRTTWSDYVFDKSYELLPLSQVKAHIQKYGYLHNTPSGEYIEKNGLELGSMASNQQAKIEEIFLHLIDLKEKIEALEEENHKLKAKLEQVKN